MLAVLSDIHAGIAPVGIDVILEDPLMNDIGALQLLDGNKELLARCGIKVIMIAEHLAA